MELDMRRWYVRWFFYSLALWDEFCELNRSYRCLKQGTNLCYFIRVSFVYAPAVLVLHVFVYGSAIGVLTALPIYLFGFTWYVAVLLAIAIVAGAIWGSRKLNRGIKAWRAAHPTPPSVEVDHEVEGEESVLRGPGFLEVVGQYVVAFKSKVCPKITFAKENG